MKKKSIIEITDGELDNLVHDKLGYKEYNFVPVEECGNDSNHSFKVDGELDKYGLEILEKWAKGQFVHYSNSTILNKLCADGHLEKGEYIVKVSW